MKGSILERRVPPVIVCLVAALLMWAIARFAPALEFDLPGRVLLAALFLAGGVAVGLAGVASFRRAATTVNPIRVETASALVTSGIFRVTRNPMYLGLLAGLIAWAIALHHPLPFLVLPLFIAYMNVFQIFPEERALRGIFGDAYERYRLRTRRWL